MKSIKELTELEILDLTEEQINLMIKFRKAEEGIPFVECPEEPKYLPIPEPDRKVYGCNLFGDDIVFMDSGELENILHELKLSESKCSVKYDSKYGYDRYFIGEMNSRSYRYEPWDSIYSKAVYSKELYDKIKENLETNKKLQEAYDKAYSAYRNSVRDSEGIIEEIWLRIHEVREKYDTLALYCRRFKNDYLPLANGDITMAMGFFRKAYTISDSTETYILAWIDSQE